MARAVWSGSIVFGIVNIPIQLYPAVRDHDLHFNQISAKDRRRIRYKKVAEGTDREVPSDEIVKGWEVAKGRYIVLEEAELARLAAQRSHTMDILDFVPLADIDPLYFDQPYHVAPGENAGRSYDLFLRALEDSGRVAIAQWVMRTKEILGALRPLGGALAVETMRYADEIVPADTVGARPATAVNERELAIARQLIDAMSTGFDATRYKDAYRERVRAYLDRKAEGGGELVLDEDWGGDRPARSGKVLDLMAALEESLRAAGAKGSAAGHQPSPARKAAAKSATARKPRARRKA